jgi:hypothetical protein
MWRGLGAQKNRTERWCVGDESFESARANLQRKHLQNIFELDRRDFKCNKSATTAPDRDEPPPAITVMLPDED